MLDGFSFVLAPDVIMNIPIMVTIPSAMTYHHAPCPTLPLPHYGSSICLRAASFCIIVHYSMIILGALVSGGHGFWRCVCSC